MLEAFGLSWLAGVLSGALSDALRERLKPATSTQKARDRAFALFERLQDIKRTTDEFVSALVGYASLVASGVPETAARLSEELGPTASIYGPLDRPSRARAVSAREQQLRAVGSPSEADVGVVRAQGALWEAAGELREALEALETALKEIDPQLAVHQPDVSDALAFYRESRAMLLVRLEDLAWHAPLESAAELQAIVDRAQQNRRVIDGAVDEFRSFLASQFSFKDSF